MDNNNSNTPKKYNNPDYRYYVVHTENYKIHSGWEYKDDAHDQLNELSDEGQTMYSVYTARHLKSKCNMYPDSNCDWERFEGFWYETKQYKVVVEEVKYCTYIVDAKSEEDVRMNTIPECDGEHIYTKPKSDEIIHIEPYVKDNSKDDETDPDDNGSVSVELLDNTIDNKDDIFAMNGLLESVLCKEFSHHESSEIVNLLVGFAQYSQELTKDDKNTEDDFNDYLKSYLRVIYPSLNENKPNPDEGSFEIDMTPSWGFVAESMLALIQINYGADPNKKDYKLLKEQLIHMSQVADSKK